MARKVTLQEQVRNEMEVCAPSENPKKMKKGSCAI